MSPGVTFERVYRGLKERIVSGTFRPGEQLEPSALSVELVASITPVRDALHRLVGEGLVWTPRGDGFRMPIHTEATLRDLYGWSQRLLQLALTASRSAKARGFQSDDPPEEPVEPIEPAEAIARLFDAIARLAGSPEHESAVRALNDRLGAVRVQEIAIIDPAAELAEMEAALAARDLMRLRRLVGAFHKRRIGEATALLTRLQPAF